MGLIGTGGTSLGVDTHITREDAGPLLASWAAIQRERGVEANLVLLCLILAIGDLLVDGHADLPDLRDSN